jgi:hypothetical protein
VYGKGFGASRGNSQVTIGGAPAYAYALWSDKKIAFQVSSGAVTGNITVSVAGVSSNAVPFTVRSGRIFFVSPTGNDAQKGTYNRPWRTLTKAVSAMQPGDIVYAANGSSATTLQISRAGNSGSPFAIVAYPNATVTIGSAIGQDYGVRALSGGYNNWVLAGLTLSGRVKAVDATSVTGWRLVGNDVSCPNGYGSGACVQASSSSNIKFLANRVHDSGSTTSTDVANYASVQLAASNVEVGWNEIGNTRSCRALSFQTSGAKQYGLSVHDNYIHDAVCDGISFGNIDPAVGPVQAYNNIVERVGTGPAPGGVEQNYACIQASGNSGGSLQILNNTLYDCGAYVSNNSGAISAATAPTQRNWSRTATTSSRPPWQRPT